MEVAPRTRILGAVPNVPETFCTDTPAARPSSPRLISGSPSNFTLSAVKLAAAPVKRRLSTFVIPVTTTSSSTSESAFITIFIRSGLIATSWVCIPINDIFKVLEELGTLSMVNLPSISVTVPIVVPFTNTDAPTTG